MTRNMMLIPVRTSRQGTSLNEGKLKANYQDETSTAEIHADDMVQMGLKKGDQIRMRSVQGFEIVVNCKERKGSDPTTSGMIFMAYGPKSSELMEGDTASSGMPLSKHIEVEVEGPLAEDGSVVAFDPGLLASGPALGGMPGSPLSAEQAQALGSLTGAAMTPVQAAWLSGYFAAMSGGAVGAASIGPGAQGAAAPMAANLPLMTLLYGSETGNGEGIAEQIKEAAQAKGFNVTVEDMAEYDTAKLADEKIMFVISSTHGEGDPPLAAEKFHEFLQSDEAPRLENLKFAVFALGDSSYEFYCKTGKDFDQFLGDLGATRLLDCVEVDVDFEETAEEWMGTVLETYQTIAEEVAGPLQSSAEVVKFPSKEKSKYSKTTPYSAKVLVNDNISGEGSAKENRHIEVDLGDSGLSYEPGDALGVYPINNMAYVDQLLAALKRDDTESVTVAKQSVSLREALSRRIDCTGLSRVLMDKYAKLTGNTDLETLLDDAHKEEFKDYTWGREIVDMVEDFPIDGASTQAFIDILRRIPGRLYSIASSIKAHENEVHMLVGAVRYNSHGRDREGVCSTFLAGRVQDEETLSIYVQENKNFRLPSDPDTPVIMVGPGTGLAPFRAFLEERQATGAAGKNWLFFGDQHQASDYVYGDELDKMHADGFLTHLGLAFSRDQKEKIYVQNRILEGAKEIYAWLEEGGHFYICGDAERMAVDVHKALVKIIVDEGGKSEEQAEEYLKELQHAKRYQRDVY